MKDLLLLFPTPILRTNIGVQYDVSNVEFKRSPSDDGWISVDEQYLNSNKRLKDSIEIEIESYLREALSLNRLYI